MACKRTPESCDLVKIRENSLKIREKSVEICAKSVKTFAKSLKIWANSLKTRAKMAPNVLGFEKKWHSTCYGLQKWCPKSHDIFSPKIFRGNSGKNPSHTQKFTCSYTYA